MAEPSCPRVTVITATYNGARYIEAAIESILSQTFGAFEYIIVDDASTDATPEILAAYAARDLRIRTVHNAANLGPAQALNRALAAARGDYVAVLDHDDLALPERLACQVAFLDTHPAMGAVGAQARAIDESGSDVKPINFPLHPAAARWQLLFGASLLHSASLFRRALLQRVGGYSAQHPYLCDYELLVRLVEHCAITNLPDILTCYRHSPTQVSAVSRVAQSGQKLLLQYSIQQHWLGLRPDLGVFRRLLEWRYGAPQCTPIEADAAIRWLDVLFARYGEVMTLDGSDQAAIAQICMQRWLVMAHHAYYPLRSASRVCWQHACGLGGDLMRSPETFALLRRYPLRRQKTPQPSIA
jgi:glycosyltransferase involved in cell wall biosynthesis